MLTVYEKLPEKLLSLSASELHTVLPGPALIHLKGRQSPALFVSVLLHGNEPSGWEAIRQLLTEFINKKLPRSLSLFIGNVSAAEARQRLLAGQQDYNRIWGAPAKFPENKMAQQVLDEMKNRGIFLALDIHNNTGTNPHYACVRRTDDAFLHLARLYSRTIIYFTKPDYVLAEPFSDLCPAATIEAGKPGDEKGIRHVKSYIASCLQLDHLPKHPVPAQDVDLFHTVATIKIPANISFSFSDQEADLLLNEDLDQLNFSELPGETTIGKTRTNKKIKLDVADLKNKDVWSRYFHQIGDEIRTKRPMMPSMLTLNENIIRQDCLCYLMERYPLERS